MATLSLYIDLRDILILLFNQLLSISYMIDLLVMTWRLMPRILMSVLASRNEQMATSGCSCDIPL